MHFPFVALETMNWSSWRKPLPKKSIPLLIPTDPTSCAQPDRYLLPRYEESSSIIQRPKDTRVQASVSWKRQLIGYFNINRQGFQMVGRLLYSPPPLVSCHLSFPGRWAHGIPNILPENPLTHKSVSTILKEPSSFFHQPSSFSQLEARFRSYRVI